MRADRPSLTSSLVAAIRAFYTSLPAPYDVAPDPFAALLVPPVLTLPARVAALAARAGAGPALHRIAGAAALGLTQHVALRTRAIDDALHEGLAQGATQLVVLGAGLDSRAVRIDALAGARVFEVDHPSTHRYKAERLRLAGAPSRGVVRVAIDFERDRLDAALLRAGLDPTARSFWIWEGVTVYLTPDAIAATLAAVGALSPPGSRLAVTYTRPGRRRLAVGLDLLARALGRAVGEPIHGMMEAEAMRAALRDAGFRCLTDESAADWAARHWPGEAPADEWERLAVAERVGPDGPRPQN